MSSAGVRSTLGQAATAIGGSTLLFHPLLSSLIICSFLSFAPQDRLSLPILWNLKLEFQSVFCNLTNQALLEVNHKHWTHAPLWHLVMLLFLCNTEQHKLPVHKPDVSDLSQKTLTALAGVLALCSDENQQDVIRSCSSALTWKLLLRHCFGSWSSQTLWIFSYLHSNVFFLDLWWLSGFIQ